MVRRPPLEDLDKDEDWERMPTPLLVVEVSSKSTRRRDVGPKRDFYIEVGVPEYWVVDRQYRTLRVVRAGVEDLVLGDSYSWQPAGSSEQLVVQVQPLFR
jgi:Uma2 family endonuclease